MTCITTGGQITKNIGMLCMQRLFFKGGGGVDYLKLNFNLLNFNQTFISEQTNPEKYNRHTQQIMNLATQLAVKELLKSKCLAQFINTSSNV